MKRLYPAIVAFSAVSAFSFAPGQVTADDNLAAVQAANDRFYAALNDMFQGDLTKMQQVWSHAEDVSYMGPMGGYQTGWEQVSKMWQAQAELKLGGEVEPHDVHFTVGSEIAIAQGYEIGKNISKAGASVDVKLRATNIYRKENGVWKMIGHHTDKAKFLEQELPTP